MVEAIGSERSTRPCLTAVTCTPSTRIIVSTASVWGCSVVWAATESDSAMNENNAIISLQCFMIV